MINDVIATDRIIGLIQPKFCEEEEVSLVPESAELKKTGSIGRITSFSEVDDGRLMITVTGISRFVISAEEPSQTPYRICQVSYVPFEQDLIEGYGEDEVDREHFLDVLRTYLKANDLKADWDSIHRSSNEFLVNTLSMISPYGAEEKQALLEAPDLKTRAEVLVALAEMELASRDDGSGTTLQ